MVINAKNGRTTMASNFEIDQRVNSFIEQGIPYHMVESGFRKGSSSQRRFERTYKDCMREKYVQLLKAKKGDSYFVLSLLEHLPKKLDLDPNQYDILVKMLRAEVEEIG